MAFQGPSCPPSAAGRQAGSLAVVDELSELAGGAAALLGRSPRSPFPHVPQHPDRLELPVGGAVALGARRRVDEPPRATPRGGEDAIPGVAAGAGGLEDRGVERANVVWNG